MFAEGAGDSLAVRIGQGDGEEEGILVAGRIALDGLGNGQAALGVGVGQGEDGDGGQAVLGDGEGHAGDGDFRVLRGEAAAGEGVARDVLAGFRHGVGHAGLDGDLQIGGIVIGSQGGGHDGAVAAGDGHIGCNGQAGGFGDLHQAHHIEHVGEVNFVFPGGDCTGDFLFGGSGLGVAVAGLGDGVPGALGQAGDGEALTVGDGDDGLAVLIEGVLAEGTGEGFAVRIGQGDGEGEVLRGVRRIALDGLGDGQGVEVQLVDEFNLILAGGDGAAVLAVIQHRRGNTVFTVGLGDGVLGAQGQIRDGEGLAVGDGNEEFAAGTKIIVAERAAQGLVVRVG